MSRRAVVFLLLLFSAAVRGQGFTAAWWNVENYFDTKDDTLTADEEFTPEGTRHWTRQKFIAKRDGIYKTLLTMELPDVVGLGEVENDYVLDELCSGTPLGRRHYAYVHYESADKRGIDCALLYRTNRFAVLQSSAICLTDTAAGFYTRDILYVKGVTGTCDTVCLLMNHWPSKRGGTQAERHRMAIAKVVRRTMDSLHIAHPTALILAMGDMNATAEEPPIAEGMGFGDRCRNEEGIENLNCLLPSGQGSYRYQGTWQYIDAMFMLADEGWKVEKMESGYYPHLLTDEKHNPGRRPKHTYLGTRYEGGISDHLPLILRLQRQKTMDKGGF